MYRLWIDDERPAPEGFDWVAKTSDEAIAYLSFASHGLVEISFDHDLGYNWEDGHPSLDGDVPDDTTRPVMLWMIEHNVWPEQLTIHTGNPVGREWLLGMANRYGPPEMEIYQIFNI